MAGRVVVDGSAVPFADGDTVLVAMAREGKLPPGCLCNAGDCPHCLASVDGIPHKRMCQTAATDGMEVLRYPVDVHPPLPPRAESSGSRHGNRHVDVVVIGGGTSGRAEALRLQDAGRSVEVLETRTGSEALAVYDGPVVLARVDGEIVRFHCQEVVVATGAADIHPIVPGANLPGVLTPSAASHFASRGVELGTVVAIGSRPPGVECRLVAGRLVRIEGGSRVTGAVVDVDGSEVLFECDTVTVDLGTYPRDRP